MSTYSTLEHPSKELPKAYEAMIYSKWLHSLRFGNDYFKLIDKHPFYTNYHKYLEQLMSQPECKVRLAVLSDDHDVVLGFSVYRNNVLHYIHVHKDMRKQGIGTVLLPDGIDTITHLTTVAMSIWASKYSNFRFNPFSL